MEKKVNSIKERHYCIKGMTFSGWHVQTVACFPTLLFSTGCVKAFQLLYTAAAASCSIHVYPPKFFVFHQYLCYFSFHFQWINALLVHLASLILERAEKEVNGWTAGYGMVSYRCRYSKLSSSSIFP